MSAPATRSQRRLPRQLAILACVAILSASARADAPSVHRLYPVDVAQHDNITPQAAIDAPDGAVFGVRYSQGIWRVLRWSGRAIDTATPIMPSADDAFGLPIQSLRITLLPSGTLLALGRVATDGTYRVLRLTAADQPTAADWRPTHWRAHGAGPGWTGAAYRPGRGTLSNRSIAWTPDGGRIWYGEYRIDDNGGESTPELYLWESTDDGNSWHVKWSVNEGMTASQVHHKHIHGLAHDPERNELHVALGDAGTAAAVQVGPADTDWHDIDGLPPASHLRASAPYFIRFGEQRYRTISPIYLNGWVYDHVDAGGETDEMNGIWRWRVNAEESGLDYEQVYDFDDNPALGPLGHRLYGGGSLLTPTGALLFGDYIAPVAASNGGTDHSTLTAAAAAGARVIEVAHAGIFETGETIHVQPLLDTGRNWTRTTVVAVDPDAGTVVIDPALSLPSGPGDSVTRNGNTVLFFHYSANGSDWVTHARWTLRPHFTGGRFADDMFRQGEDIWLSGRHLRHTPDRHNQASATIVNEIDTWTPGTHGIEELGALFWVDGHDGDDARAGHTPRTARQTVAGVLVDAPPPLGSRVLVRGLDQQRLSVHRSGGHPHDPPEQRPLRFPTVIERDLVQPGPTRSDPADAGLQDRDGDGLVDAMEQLLGLDPERPEDAGLDPDADGLDTLTEQTLGSDPLVADTDRDTLADGLERALGTDPLQPEADPVARSTVLLRPVDGIGGTELSEVVAHLPDRVITATSGDAIRVPLLTRVRLESPGRHAVTLTPTTPGEATVELYRPEDVDTMLGELRARRDAITTTLDRLDRIDALLAGMVFEPPPAPATDGTGSDGRTAEPLLLEAGCVDRTDCTAFAVTLQLAPDDSGPGSTLTLRVRQNDEPGLDGTPLTLGPFRALDADDRADLQAWLLDAAAFVRGTSVTGSTAAHALFLTRAAAALTDFSSGCSSHCERLEHQLDQRFRVVVEAWNATTCRLLTDAAALDVSPATLRGMCDALRDQVRSATAGELAALRVRLAGSTDPLAGTRDLLVRAATASRSPCHADARANGRCTMAPLVDAWIAGSLVGIGL